VIIEYKLFFLKLTNSISGIMRLEMTLTCATKRGRTTFQDCLQNLIYPSAVEEHLSCTTSPRIIFLYACGLHKYNGMTTVSILNLLSLSPAKEIPVSCR